MSVEFTIQEWLWIFFRAVIYTVIFFVVLGIVVRLYRLVSGNLSEKIAFAFGLHPNVKEPLAVKRLRGERDTYIMFTGKNPVSFESLAQFVPQAQAAMKIKSRIISFEPGSYSDAIRIGFGMNKSKIDDEGRKVGTLSWKDFPPPYKLDKKKLFTRTTVNLAIQGNDRGILASWMQTPFLLVAGPTGAGKTGLLHYLIAQTTAIYPSHWTITSTEKGLQDWQKIIYSPSVWKNYDENVPVNEHLLNFNPLPNICVTTEIEQFKNAVSELSDIIEQRKVLLKHYGAGDIRELPKIKAYQNDFGDEYPEQLFLIVDDATPMEGRGADDELQIVATDWVSFTRTLGVHVWVFLQDPRIKPNSRPDWANMRRQALVVSLAGMSAVQNDMLLGIKKGTPDIKGLIAVNKNDVLQTGVVPRIDQLSLAAILEMSAKRDYSQRQLRDFGTYRDRLNKVGFVGKTLERKLEQQHKFIAMC